MWSRNSLRYQFAFPLCWSLLFCCYDKPSQKQLREEMVYLASTSRLQSITEGNQGKNPRQDLEEEDIEQHDLWSSSQNSAQLSFLYSPGQNKLFFHKLALVMLLYHSNIEVTTITPSYISALQYFFVHSIGCLFILLTLLLFNSIVLFLLHNKIYIIVFYLLNMIITVNFS